MITIFTLEGSRIDSFVGKDKLTLDLDSYITGIYFIHIESGDYKLTRKLIKL